MYWIIRLAVVTILLSTTALAIISPTRSGIMPAHLKKQADIIRGQYGQGYWAQHMVERRIMRENAASTGRPLIPSIDTAFIPVLLGRYVDVTERFSSAAFQALLFDGPNPSGTVTDFYWQNSFGQMVVTGNVEQWFTAPRTFDYYVHDGGSRNAGLEYGGRDFTIDVLARADSTIDFSKYIKGTKDGQNRWHVPQVAIIHTGADAAGGADNIWSHRWNIRQRLLQRKAVGSDPYFDVARVTTEGYYLTNDLGPDGAPVVFDGDYAIEPELSGSSNAGTKLIEIGVFTHEFGHVFGLPDLYDTDNSSEGIGQWCVMASGSWGGDGRHPAYPSNFSAYCKERMGWVTPVVVTGFVKGQTIRNAEDFQEIYKVWKLGTPGQQYFLIENRQQVQFDVYLPGSGLLIYHIDKSRTSNQDENHYMVDVEQADGSRDLNAGRNRGDNGDPFPGARNNHTFDGQSTPNSADYASAQTYVGIRNISSSDMVMTADIDVGTRPYVVMDSYSISEGNGANGNGRVEPGESGTVKLRFSNLYPTAGSGLAVSVSSSTAGVVADTVVTLSIGALGRDSITIAECFHVAPSFDPREVTFSVSVGIDQDTLPYSGATVFGYPGLLFVDRDSTAENILRYYESAAAENGKYFERFRTQGNSFSAAAFGKRDVIVWFSGRTKTNTLPDSAQQELEAVLNAGKSVFVTGQNIAEDLAAGSAPFLEQVLHARWSKNVLVGRTVYGSSSDPLGTQMPKFTIAGSGGAANQTSPDELMPDSLAHPFLRYNSATGTSYGGVWYEDPTTHGKVAFFGFGFEAINDSSGFMTKGQVMNILLNWFSGVTAVPGDGVQRPVVTRYALDQNYPNPFNPRTAIVYQLLSASVVRLTVFDCLGREVGLLVNGTVPEGRHSVDWDAARFASGVYFYRLEARSVDGGSDRAFTEIRKMVLLK